MDIRKNVLISKSGAAVAQAAQGGGAVTIPGGVQELWRCGTEGPGQRARWDWRSSGSFPTSVLFDGVFLYCSSAGDSLVSNDNIHVCESSIIR